jgi:hypothetical protein
MKNGKPSLLLWHHSGINQPANLPEDTVGNLVFEIGSQMTRRYYSSRKQPGNLTLDDLYSKLQSLYLLYRDKDYFKEKAGITTGTVPDAIKYEASLALTFLPFPIDNWSWEKVTEDHVFETLEFLYDHVSKPGDWKEFFDREGESWLDYDGYDEIAGRTEFMITANLFLADYQQGYELTERGEVVELGAHGLRHILNAEIVPYDEANVDSKVRDAINKWRSRHSGIQEKKEAIRELADVFEWLKKTKRLSAVLAKKDESAIFEIANNFAIRHHDPKQNTNYDRAIWFAWIFHFYLATYHATIRLLIKDENKKKGVAPRS